MANLNKEFFDELFKKYPMAVEHFRHWLAEYKEEINWNHLFFVHTNNRQIDFYDLPIEMQNGIIARFDLEKFHGKERAEKIHNDLPRQMNNLFNDIQTSITAKKLK